jgi:hypothetical protein
MQVGLITSVLKAILVDLSKVPMMTETGKENLVQLLLKIQVQQQPLKHQSIDIWNLQEVEAHSKKGQS